MATARAWCPWNFQNPMGFRSTSKIAEGFFFKTGKSIFDIHGNLGKHLKPFDHALAEPSLGLGLNSIWPSSEWKFIGNQLRIIITLATAILFTVPPSSELIRITRNYSRARDGKLFYDFAI